MEMEPSGTEEIAPGVCRMRLDDHFMLLAERGANPMHIGALLMLDVPEAERAQFAGRIVRQFDERLPLTPMSSFVSSGDLHEIVQRRVDVLVTELVSRRQGALGLDVLPFQKDRSAFCTHRPLHQPGWNGPDHRPAKVPGERFRELPVRDDARGDSIEAPFELLAIDDMQQHPHHIVDVDPGKRLPAVANRRAQP
jgi:hypothetical protein